MWRLLLLCLAVGLNEAKILENSFRPQRLYKYKYEAQVASGIAGQSQQKAVIKLKSHLDITYSPPKIFAKLSNVKLYSLNGKAGPMVDPAHQMVPTELMWRLTGPEALELVQDLVLPWAFDYDGLEVGHVYVQPKDPYWSVNIKRGVSNLFSVKGINVMINQDVNFTSIPENGPTGLCLSNYQSANKSDELLMQTFKVREIGSCAKIPLWWKSVFDPLTKFDQMNDYKRDFMGLASRILYTTTIPQKNEGAGVLIYSAVGGSSVLIKPSADKFEGIVTVLNQTLHLEHALNAESPQPGSLEQKPLALAYPELVNDPIITQPGPKLFGPMFDEDALIRLAMENTAQTHTEESMWRIFTFIDLIRTANESMLESFYNTYMDYQPNKPFVNKVGKWLWNYLPVAGTKQVALLLTKKCNVNSTCDSRCSVAMMTLALTAEPNPELIDLLQTPQRCQSAVFNRTKVLLWSSLKHKAFNRQLYNLTESQKYKQLLEQQLELEVNPNKMKQIQKQIQEVSDHIALLLKYQPVQEMQAEKILKTMAPSKLLYIKALGNMGRASSIPILEEIIHDESEDLITRSQAIFAMRRINVTHRVEILKVTLPLLLNMSAPTYLRIPAFIISYHKNLTRPTWELIVERMRNDSNIQVSSFVMSFISAVSNTTDPCLQAIAKNASVALKQTKYVKASFEFSKERIFSFFNNDKKWGVRVQVGSISQENISYPNAANFLLHGHLFNYPGDVLEVGFHTLGLDGVVEKLLSYDGVLTKRGAIFDLFNRTARHRRSLKSPEEAIMEELDIPMSEFPDPIGHIYLKSFENELVFYNMTEKLQNFKKYAQFNISFDDHKWKMGVKFAKSGSMTMGDAKYILPTDAGIPVFLRLSSHTSFCFNGSAGITVNPAFYKFERPGKPPADYEAYIGVNASSLMGIIGSVTADMANIRLGVATSLQAKTAIPFNASVFADLSENKLVVVKVKPPVQNGSLVELETSPYTFIHVLPRRDVGPNPNPDNRSASEVLAPEITNYKPVEVGTKNKLYQVNINATQSMLGVQLMVNGQFVRSPHPYLAPYPFGGKNIVKVTLANTSDPALEWELQVKCFAKSSIPYPPGKTMDPEKNECNSWLSRFTGCLVNNDDWDDTSMPKTTPAPAPSYPDFVDLTQNKITMEQVRQKLQKKTNVKLPFVGSKWAMVAVLKSKAKSGTPRGAQLEVYWRSANFSTKSDLQAHLLRLPVPGYDTQPWMMNVVSKAVFPIQWMFPEQLMNASMHAEQFKAINFILGLKIHRPVIQVLNDSLFSMFSSAQHEPLISPRIILQRLSDDVFIRSKTPFVLALRETINAAIYREKVIEDLKEKARDLNFAVNEKSALIEHIHVTQDTLKQLLKMKQKKENLEAEESALVVSTLASLWRTVMMLNDITQRFEGIPEIRAVMAPVTKGMVKLNMTLLATTSTSVPSKFPLSPIPTPNTDAKDSDILKILTELITMQSKAIKALIHYDPAKDATPKLYELTEKAKVMIEEIGWVWVSQNYGNEAVVEGTMLACAQGMILTYMSNLYTKVSDQNPVDGFHFNPSLFNLQLQMNMQNGILATMGAIQNKHSYDDVIFPKVASVMQIQDLKTLQKIEKMQIITLMSTLPMVPGIRNTTKDAGLLRHMKEQMFKVIGNLTITQKLIVQEIEHVVSLQHPNYLHLHRFVEMMVRQNQIANILRHIRSSFPEPDRVAMYLAIEKVLFNVEYVRKNISVLFDLMEKNAVLGQHFQHPEKETGEDGDIQSQLQVAEKYAQLLNKSLAQLQAASVQVLEQKLPAALADLTSLAAQYSSLVQQIQQQGNPSFLKQQAAKLKQDLANIAIQLETILQNNKVVANSSQLLSQLQGVKDTLEQLLPSAGPVSSYLLPVPKFPHVSISTNLTWGSALQKSMKTQLTAIKSVAQMGWEFQQLDVTSRWLSVDNLLHGIQEGTSNVTYMDSEFFHQLNSYNHVHLTADTSDPLPIWWRRKLGQVREYAKWKLYNFSKPFELPTLQVPSQSVCIMSEMKPFRKTADLFVVSKSEINKFQDFNFGRLPLSRYIDNVFFLRTRLLKAISANHLPGFCEYANSTISTFDKFTYRFPYANFSCMTVLAIDTSPIPRFAVMLTENSSFTELGPFPTVFLGETQIQLLPNFTVFINDTEMPALTPFSPVVLMRTVEYGQEVVDVKVTTFENETVVMDSPGLGLQVVFDGIGIVIRISPLYRGRVKGMCGTFDGNPKLPVGPQGELLPDLEEVILSYSFNDSECLNTSYPYDSNLYKFKFSSTKPFSTTTTTEKPIGQPVLRTGVFLPKLKQSTACLSMVPVQDCPKGFKPANKGSRQKVPFYCTKKTDELQEQLKQLKKHQIDIIPLPAGAKPSRYRRVRLPLTCKEN